MERFLGHRHTMDILSAVKMQKAQLLSNLKYNRKTTIVLKVAIPQGWFFYLFILILIIIFHMGCYDIIYCIALPLRSASFSFLQSFQSERLPVYPIGMVIELVEYSDIMRVE